MADKFIDVPVVADEQSLANGAIDRLKSEWPDYEPNDADMEVVLIEGISPMAANAAVTASQVPGAVFAKAGTDLFRVPFLDGAQAVGVVVFSAIDADGHTIPALTEVSIDAYSFVTTVASEIPAGAVASGPVPVRASADGAAANGLPGEVVQPLSALAFVEDVMIVGTTSGGVDAETPAEYRNRLSRELELQARTLVTTRDYELMGLSDAAVGRILALHDGQRRVKVVATGLDGLPLDEQVKDRLIARYADYRLVNTTVTVADATYTTITVTYVVVAYPGYDHVALVASINAMLATMLKPLTWGLPQYGDPQSARWQNQTVVRRNKIIDLIGDVEGVDYVSEITVAGSAGAASGQGDWTLPGDVPLVTSGAHQGTVAP